MVSADLCSQPTISRLENLPDARALLRMGRAMVDHYCHHAGADIAIIESVFGLAARWTKVAVDARACGAGKPKTYWTKPRAARRTMGIEWVWLGFQGAAGWPWDLAEVVCGDRWRSDWHETPVRRLPAPW